MEYIGNKRLKEGYYRAALKNGLTVMVYPMPHKTAVYAMLSTPVGSATLDFLLDGRPVHVPEGTAHFLEHKMFENENGIDAFELFAKTGASANAYTSFDKTCYLFEASLDPEESLRTILQFVGAPYFTEKTVEKEQGIIGQEIKMYLDNPDWRLMFGLLSLLYKSHPVKEDIAGTVESIAGLTPGLLHDFYDAFYNPSQMVLAVSGNIAPERVMEICEAEFSEKDWKTHDTRVIPYPETAELAGTLSEEEMPIFAPQFSLGFKEIPFAEEGRAKQELALDMLLDLLAGDTSDLFRSLYDGGLITNYLSAEALSGGDYLCTMFSAESEYPETAAARVAEAIQNMRETGIDDDRFEECRRAFLGDALVSFEGIDSVASGLTHAHFKNGGIYDMIEWIETMQKEDVSALLDSMLREEASALSIIRPRES